MKILQVRRNKDVVTTKASTISDITCCGGDIMIFFEHKEPQQLRCYNNAHDSRNLYNDLLSAWIISTEKQAIVIVNLDKNGYVSDWKVGSMTDIFDDLMM